MKEEKISEKLKDIGILPVDGGNLDDTVTECFVTAVKQLNLSEEEFNKYCEEFVLESQPLAIAKDLRRILKALES